MGKENMIQEFQPHLTSPHLINFQLLHKKPHSNNFRVLKNYEAGKQLCFKRLHPPTMCAMKYPYTNKFKNGNVDKYFPPRTSPSLKHIIDDNNDYQNNGLHYILTTWTFSCRQH